MIRNDFRKMYTQIKNYEGYFVFGFVKSVKELQNILKKNKLYKKYNIICISFNIMPPAPRFVLLACLLKSIDRDRWTRRRIV